jgi:hypothetical protein
MRGFVHLKDDVAMGEAGGEQECLRVEKDFSVAEGQVHAFVL